MTQDCLNPWDSVGFRIFREGGGIPDPLPRREVRDATARGAAIVLVLDGDKWKPRESYRPRQGGSGFGINFENVGYTLTAIDRHIVAILNKSTKEETEQ